MFFHIKTAAHARAQQIAEYLTFFCEVPEYLRRQVAANVDAMLINPGIYIVPPSHASFCAGFELYRARPDNKSADVDAFFSGLDLG